MAMTEAQLLARSKGGLARVRNHTREELTQYGKLGGRPRRQSSRLQTAPEAKFNFEEVNATAMSLRTLKGLVKKLHPEMFEPFPG
jgi:hypothetical protein